MIWLKSESSNTAPSFYISSHAKFLSNFNVQLRGNRAGITLNGIYKKRDAQKAAGINAEVKEDYFALNMRGNLFLQKYKSTIFVQVDNVFNHEGQDLLGSRLPGRWLSAGFEINFR
jgi:iron complex outermembrane receptor protein